MTGKENAEGRFSLSFVLTASELTLIHKELSVYSSGSVINFLSWKVSFIDSLCLQSFFDFLFFFHSLNKVKG